MSHPSQPTQMDRPPRHPATHPDTLPLTQTPYRSPRHPVTISHHRYAISPRVAAQQLLDDLLDAYGRRALPPLLHAVKSRLDEASAARARGAEHWWRIQEAATLGISVGSAALCKATRKEAKQGASLTLSPAHVFTVLLLPDASADRPALLRARALCTAARFASDLAPPSIAALLQAVRSHRGNPIDRPL